MPSFIPKIVYDSPAVTIQFEFPPQGDYLNLDLDAKESTATSYNGKTQTVFSYNEKIIRPKFFLIKDSIKESVELFYLNFGSKGKTFNYYPDSDSVSFLSVTLKDKKFEPKIITTRAGLFLWAFELIMRMVV